MGKRISTQLEKEKKHLEMVHCTKFTSVLPTLHIHAQRLKRRAEEDCKPKLEETNKQLLELGY